MKTNPDSPQTPQELLHDLHTLVDEAEKMMGNSLAEHSADAITALRTRFEAAQQRFATLYAGAKTQIVAGARCTDAAIRSHPYQSLAVAAGAGLLAGILLGRRGK